jgi:anti-sigma regulatory factor (Ser/Thr protein kinase)
MAEAHPQEAMETFPAEPGSVPEARHWVRRLIEDWHLDGRRHEIELLTTELSANAVLHARTDFEVAVRYDGEVVRVEVADRTPDPPRRRSAQWSPDSLGGRGLAFVELLSTRSGVEPREPGKAVWFEIGGHRRSELVG